MELLDIGCSACSRGCREGAKRRAVGAVDQRAQGFRQTGGIGFEIYCTAECAASVVNNVVCIAK